MRIPQIGLTIGFLAASLCLRAQTAAYPSAIATDVNLKVAVNGVSTILIATVNTIQTTMSVSSCAGIVPNVLVTIDQEIMPVTGCSGTVLVVGSRGFDGTTAATHASTTIVNAFVDAWHHNSLRVEVEAIETALGVNLANVATTGSSPSFANGAFSGNVTVGGTFGVTGATTHTGAVSLSSTLAVTGLTTLTGGLAAAAITGNATVGGTLGVTGATSLAALAITGAFTGTHAQNLGTGDGPTFAGLTLTGALSGTAGTFSGAVSGTTGTFSSNGSFGGTLAVTGTSTFTGAVTLAGGVAGTLSAVAGTFSGNLATSLQFRAGGGMSGGLGIFAATTTCSMSIEGYFTTISDSPVNTWGTAITTGGGGNVVGAYCNGTNWTVWSK